MNVNEQYLLEALLNFNSLKRQKKMRRIPATMEKVKEWKNIPLVKLSKMLEPMLWFSGKCELIPDKNDYEQDGLIPKYFKSIILYRGHTIKIKCFWEIRESPYGSTQQEYPDRFAIGVLEPWNNKFQIKRYWTNDTIKNKHSRYYSTAIDKIEDFIYDAQEVIDDKIAEEEKNQKQLEESKEAKKRLCKNLDLPITLEGGVILNYREDYEYNLRFTLLENGFYEVSHLGGEYTEIEIEKMIKIVGGNPRAIAERILK